MERFDIAEYIKQNYRAEYPFQKGGYLPLDVNKIEHLINEIHQHYEKQLPVDFEPPKLVDEEYSFKAQKEAEVMPLHKNVDDKRQIVIRKFREVAETNNYILCYHDKEGNANYAVGGDCTVKDLLYLQYVLNYQIAIQLQTSNMEH